MKKIAFLIVSFAIFCNVFAITAQAKRSGEDYIYPQTFIVDEIDSEKDLVYLKTLSGMLYTWQGVEDWQVGDIAAAIMDNNRTPNTIKDDKIIVLEYSGYIY